jgi:hypothetical protein
VLVVKRIEYPAFKELLIAYPNFDRVALGASLFEPIRHQRNVVVPSGGSCPLVEWLWCPVKVNTVHRMLVLDRLLT